jgi:hypothetical protein
MTEKLYAGLPAEMRIDELEEAVKCLEHDNADLIAERDDLKRRLAKFDDMVLLYERGGFEAVIAAKDELIRSQSRRIEMESGDKAAWARRAKWWQKTAIALGYVSPHSEVVP